jgi:hypothetical protein
MQSVFAARRPIHSTARLPAIMGSMQKNGLRDAAVFIGLGIGALVLWRPSATTVLFGSAMVGAGLFAPFGRARQGISVGIVLPVVIYIVALVVMATLGKLSTH